MRLCSIAGCSSPHLSRGYCNKHYKKWQRYGDPLGGYEEQSPKGHGSFRAGGYHRRAVNGKEKLEHVLIAERVLGRALPDGAEVHHVDGNPWNNKNDNLIVCPSKSYHRLLHAREKILNECGHADWRKCARCREYDAPENMVRYPSGALHHITCKEIS